MSCDNEPANKKAACECLRVAKTYNDELNRYKENDRIYREDKDREYRFNNKQGEYGDEFNRYKDDLSRWEFGWKNSVTYNQIVNERHDDWCRGDAQQFKNDGEHHFPDSHFWIHKQGDVANDKDTLSSYWSQNAGVRDAKWGTGLALFRGRCKLNDEGINHYANQRMTRPQVRPQPQPPNSVNLTCCSLSIDNIKTTSGDIDINNIQQQCGKVDKEDKQNLERERERLDTERLEKEAEEKAEAETEETESADYMYIIITVMVLLLCCCISLLGVLMQGTLTTMM